MEDPAGTGERYWGRYGAAGLLIHDPDRNAVLLQLRAQWSHFGGTWGIPGGALHAGETAVDGAIREAGEEAGVPAEAIEVRWTRVRELGFWRYTTVVARCVQAFEPGQGDDESDAVSWIDLDEVAQLPLHPGFGQDWPELRAHL